MSTATKDPDGGHSAACDGAASTAPASGASSASAAAGVCRPPHALDSWESIQSHLHGKQLAIFLDYDGTLTPIVSDPSAALISAAQRARVAELAQRYPTAIVTGRKLDTIRKFVLEGAGGPLPGLERLYFAGSHGFDIACPPAEAGGAGSNKQVASHYLPLLHQFYEECVRGCAGIQGSLVEDSLFSISVHYRNVKSEADRAAVESVVQHALEPFAAGGQLQLHHGKMVYEIRPNIAWNKGEAVKYLLGVVFSQARPADAQSSGSSSLSLPDGRQVVPVYVGDDVTDEDAFKMLRQYNSSESHALSVFVRADDKARDSAANYVLRDTEEVGQLLQRLAKL